MVTITFLRDWKATVTESVGGFVGYESTSDRLFLAHETLEALAARRGPKRKGGRMTTVTLPYGNTSVISTFDVPEKIITVVEKPDAETAR